MKPEEIMKLDWQKTQGLMPAIIQDNQTSEVLMFAYMSIEALEQTLASKKVTLYSRSKQRLWIKGETSGNYLQLVQVIADCDKDSLLVLVEPAGPTCHTGNTSCFNYLGNYGMGFLGKLEQVIFKRYQDKPIHSYTTELFNSGIQRMAQKVGEEAVETLLAATSGDKKATVSETADLLYHLLTLLRSCDISLADVTRELSARSKITSV
jgi:phosphoribosyl-AMP cyclohydrolase / phosphoribosyl-ATP pyrophosphohydrolase